MNISKYFKYIIFSFICVFVSAISVNAAVLTSKLEMEVNPYQIIDIYNLFDIKEFKTMSWSSGGAAYSVGGCNEFEPFCEISLSPFDYKNGNTSVLVVHYINNAGKEYKTTLTLVEKDPNMLTKAFPGMMGTCEFDSNWEYAQWSDNSGKKYTFHETKISGAVLPKCSSSAQHDKLYTFKGWGSGYKPGDPLNTATTCKNVVPAGTATQKGKSYVPCYEIVPHVRLAPDAGSLGEAGSWESYSDGTYIAKGASATSTIKLPDLVYSGFRKNSKLKYWQNSLTGETKKANESVYFDGSLWLAVADISFTTQMELFKIIGVGSTEDFLVDGMTGCYVEAGSPGNVTVNYTGTACRVTGVTETDDGVYVNVIVKLSGSDKRTYKFSVEDRTGLSQNGNEIFEVSTEQAIVIGKNDSEVANKVYTDVCDTFFVNSANYSSTKVGFAVNYYTRKNSNNILYSGTYTVKSQCDSDTNKYVAFCLDPGRRGPESAGAYYSKAEDIKMETDFGKLVAYIVANMNVKNFNNNTHRSNDTYNRVASHVALRVSAMKNGFSLAYDSSDLVYATHYYPYAAIAQNLNAISGNITEAKAATAVDKISKVNGTSHGMIWNGTDGSGGTYVTSDSNGNSFSEVRKRLVKILGNYDGSSSSMTEGFERTISSNAELYGTNGYKITYTGTITMPQGSKNVQLIKCTSGSGVQCGVPTLTYKGMADDGKRTVYDYSLTITVPNINNLVIPKSAEAKKALGYKLQYDGPNMTETAFIANPTSGANNLQRMLILTVSTPSAYLYFDVVPNCNLSWEIFKPSNCLSESSCTINGKLFEAAGCCKHVLDTTSYLSKTFCEEQCTYSTLASACAYNSSAGSYADFYEIREGSSYDGSKWIPSIGKCVAQVTKKFKNDNAVALENNSQKSDFTYYDDNQNVVNVSSYSTNRYCQITCKEDWDLSMEAFGSFVGNKAVAAGTYFQIIDHDMFISGTRTCYSTFINYDRFMANVVDYSNKLVENYNYASEWSHVWTDIKEQKDDTYSTSSKITNNHDAPVCVEYADNCPVYSTNYSATAGAFFWESTEASGRSGGCMQVPDYGNTGVINESLSCSQSRDSITTYRGHDYDDSDMKFTNSAANDYKTRCTFTRTYCDGKAVEKSGDKEKLTSDKKCEYKTYTKRSTGTVRTHTYERDTEDCELPPPKEDDKTTVAKTAAACTCPDGYSRIGTTLKCRKKSCADGYTKDGINCYKKYCDTNYTLVDTGSGLKCYYDYCPSTHPYSYDNTECYAYTTTTSHTHTYKNILPAYEEESLRCKVYGKAVDYTLVTKNDVTKANGEGEDVYYTTTEKDPVALAEKGDNNTQNYKSANGNVQYHYGKTYTHQCTAEYGEYKPNGAVGTSSCVQEDFYGTYSKSNDMFCSKHAPTSSNKKAFCYVGDAAADNQHDGGQGEAGSGYHANDASNSDEKSAFEYMTDNMLTESEKKFNTYKSEMLTYHNLIYTHASDIYKCQHFMVHNTADDLDSSKANNAPKHDTIMGQNIEYQKINTAFNPIAQYTYDDKYFMSILEETDQKRRRNNLVEFTEKNDTVYSSLGTTYDKATNKVVETTVKTVSDPAKKVNLYRNYLRAYYYNPTNPWVENTVQWKEYTDSSNDVTAAFNADSLRSSKQIVMCSIGSKTFGTGTYEGKEGAVIAFSLVDGKPEWVGGRCYQVRVDYKKVHYVKTSLSNSSFYKNEGYWYVRGGDIKEHGDDFKDALENANTRPGSSNSYNHNEEKGRWSRLGSFNVFPISMGTARNLYQYTYTFGNIGSYYGNELGRIMGGTNAIIEDNTRTCFYEVFEEVCLCCGYKILPGDLVTQYTGQNGGFYKLSDENGIKKNSDGTLSIYTNSVSLGNITQGREDIGVASNWQAHHKFMYNGNDNLYTDKGDELKKLIETKGESIYASKPEYSYVLTPDILREIRNYNDTVGYELNFNNLIVYDSSNIACSTTACNDASSEETINFQHYGSKFLVEEFRPKVKLVNLGTIKNSDKSICVATKSDLKTKVDGMQKDSNTCRWIDYIDTDNSYTDPVTNKTAAAFRLSFK